MWGTVSIRTGFGANKAYWSRKCAVWRKDELLLGMGTQGNICKLLPVAQYSLRYQGSLPVVAAFLFSDIQSSVPEERTILPHPEHITTVQEGSNKLTLFKMCKQGEKFNILDVDGGGDRFHLLLYWELLYTIQDILYKPPDGWLFRTWDRTKEAKRSNRLQTVSVTSSNLSHNTKDIKNRSGHIVTITEDDPGWPWVKTGMRPIGRVVC